MLTELTSHHHGFQGVLIENTARQTSARHGTAGSVPAWRCTRKSFNSHHWPCMSPSARHLHFMFGRRIHFLKKCSRLGSCFPFHNAQQGDAPASAFLASNMHETSCVSRCGIRLEKPWLLLSRPSPVSSCGCYRLPLAGQDADAHFIERHLSPCLHGSDALPG